MPKRIVEAHGSAAAAGIFFDVDGEVIEFDSPFQKVTVFKNPNFGTVLLLDGLVMTTDLDQAYYHEPLVHPALTAHPDPKKVLVIGGGDGGTVTELTRYPQLERIVMVEIDPAVVEVARKHFPQQSRGLDDPRVELLFADGAAYVAEGDERFDVILIDGSDPVGPAKVLFGEAFLSTCARRLGPDGIVVTQSESPIYYQDTIRELLATLRSHFAWAWPYTGVVPTYPSGLWSWTWAGVGAEPTQRRPFPAGLELMHDGLFPRRGAVPAYMRDW